jgi:hypothetical protein
MSSVTSTGKTGLGIKRDVGGMVCAALFMLLGAFCLYETTQMTDPDSFMFPRMVITGLMGLSLVLIITSVFRTTTPVAEEAPGGAAPSTLRRVLLVVAMMGSALLMPLVGFLLSALGAFIALMLLAQHDPWTKGKMALYSLVATAIVVGFYGVFSYLLLVPLPEGSLIQIP